MPNLDLAAVRRTAECGDPVMPAQALALVERIETQHAALQQRGAYLLRLQEEYGRLGTAYAGLLSAARAWADAIVGQEIVEVERCANELMAAIARCEQKGDRP